MKTAHENAKEFLLRSNPLCTANEVKPLLPCPFCGQVPDREDPDCVCPVTRPDNDGRQVFRAGCIECAGGCGAEVTAWSAEEAVKRWNTRTRCIGQTLGDIEREAREYQEDEINVD